MGTPEMADLQLVPCLGYVRMRVLLHMEFCHRPTRCWFPQLWREASGMDGGGREAQGISQDPVGMLCHHTFPSDVGGCFSVVRSLLLAEWPPSSLMQRDFCVNSMR